jgi:DNA-binding response OmpR family regulator
MDNLNNLSEKVPLILVVDDDRSMRALLNLAMEEQGYRVALAQNGEQGIAEYKRLQPDMVLLDAVMPDMDGFTCCDRIRELSGENLIPILIITVLDDRLSIEKAFAAGATDYITKPLHWEVLSQRVQRLLSGYRAISEAQLIKQQLERQLNWEQFLRNTLQELNSGAIESQLPDILRQIQAFFQVEGIILFQQETDNFLEFSTSPPLLLDKIKIFLQNFSLESYSIEPTEIETKSILIMPLITTSKNWGLLAMYAEIGFCSWQESQIDRFKDLVNLLSIAFS